MHNPTPFTARRHTLHRLAAAALAASQVEGTARRKASGELDQELVRCVGPDEPRLCIPRIPVSSVHHRIPSVSLQRY